MTEEEVPFEEEPTEEAPLLPEVPEESVPEPPALTRGKKDLKERVECPDCNRQVSRHTLLHTHRCPAKKKAAEPVPVEPGTTLGVVPLEQFICWGAVPAPSADPM